MKISRGALIFAAIIVTILVLVGGFVWFSSLFKAPVEGQRSAIENFFSALFPFGNTTNQNPSGEGSGAQSGESGPVPTLRKVSAGPIAGFHFQEDGALLFGERETGHILKTTTAALTVTRLSNTTLPAINRILWVSDATVVLEYAGTNDAVRDYIATISTTTPDQALLGHFLPTVSQVLPSSDPKKLLEVTRGPNGISVMSASMDGGGVLTLFSSPLKSWTVLPTKKSLFMETAPASVPGYLYRIGTNGVPARVIGNLAGLMALPDPSGRYVAYSTSDAGTLSLLVLDTNTGSSYRSPLATFAEKCAWFPGNDPILFCGVPVGGTPPSIEQWYTGLKASNDNAWVIDPVAGTATAIKELAPAANQAIDVLSPSVSPDGTYAAFLNKNDLSFWVLKLSP